MPDAIKSKLEALIGLEQMFQIPSIQWEVNTCEFTPRKSAKQGMYLVDGFTKLVEISQGLWVILDGQLVGYDGLLMDSESQVVEEPSPVLAKFLEDKERGVPRAIDLLDVALGKLLLYEGFQSAQFFTGEGPLINPHWMVLFPVTTAKAPDTPLAIPLVTACATVFSGLGNFESVYKFDKCFINPLFYIRETLSWDRVIGCEEQ
ncbi:hypothetical protein HGM15179_019010 [Zosterops borbonicus]|uniref:Uncharacterized protein n=1 Tax=Zosterops borbonicus TaxID=364589 RepID=A0A8K1DBH7_9PASS|nr:hypothetical protein HGM15179_019010 [Zosterops borbonicus]